MYKLKKLLALAILFLPFMAFSQTKTKAMKVEQLNTNNFHLVDFVGWNHSMKVLAHYHTSDVKVFGDGWKTVGMIDHEKSVQQFLDQTQNSKVVMHFPIVAKGEWTAIVGVTSMNGFKMATAAKWKDGQIAEEYLFTAQVPDSISTKMQLPTNTAFSLTNSNDKELIESVDLQPEWSAVMGDIEGKRTIFFIKKKNGQEVERLVFH
jgi:hypothetical protein